MRQIGLKFKKKGLLFLASLICCLIFAGHVFADVTINILAVNGTDSAKEKDIYYVLPQDINAEDILDTAGLKLEYDVGKNAYAVVGKINLSAKETRTLKIKMRDIWVVDEAGINEIRAQVEESLKRIKGTEFYEIGLIRKESLLNRLDYILESQAQYADKVEKRIDYFKIYDDEIKNIRNDSVSVDFWKRKPPSYDDENVITFVIEAKNPSSDKERTFEHKYYLPPEVKPEHLVEVQGFDFRYDAIKGQPYLVKEEDLKAGEKKTYKISIVDVWKIQQQDIENLRDRTREAFKFLEGSEYEESATFLVGSIKKNLEQIEISQALEKNINEHISTFSDNKERFDLAENDVKSLENMLRALRETLERSKLKNVLEKLKSVKSLVELARSIFSKPEVNTAWKIIMGIVVFVAIFTVLHFAVWGKRSKDIKIEEPEEQSEQQQ